MQNFIFTSSHQTSFQDFLVNGNFTDTVLICERSIIKCHKVLLAASSRYFFELFSMVKDTNPTVVLKDISMSQLSKILEYIYSGKVAVNENELHDFREASEYFQLKIDFGNVTNDHNNTVPEFMSQETTAENLTMNSFRLNDSINSDSDSDATLSGQKSFTEPQMKKIKLADSFGIFPMNLNQCHTEDSRGNMNDAERKRRNYFAFSEQQKKKVAFEVLNDKNISGTKKVKPFTRSSFY